MAQLVVRKLENFVVKRLREEAAKQGISVEEAHRRILRKALLGSPVHSDLKTLLLDIPKAAGGEDEEDLFERQQDEPRKLDL